MSATVLVWRAIRHRPLLVLIAFLAVAAGAVAGAYVKRPSYESSAKLFVNLETRGVSLSRAEVQYGGATVQTVEAVTSQGEVLRSRQLLEATVDSLGPTIFAGPPMTNAYIKPLADFAEWLQDALDEMLVAAKLTESVSRRDALVERVEKALRVYPVRQAQVIQVSFAWRYPDVPPRFLERFLEFYLATVAELNGGGQVPDLLQAQVRRAAGDLEAAEQERRALDASSGVVDLKREKQTLSERIDRLAALLDGLPAGSGQPAASESSVEPTASAGGQIASLRAQINALRIERAKAAVAFTPDSRQLRELEGQIAVAETVLAAGVRDVRETLAASRARMQALQSVEAAYDRIGRNIEIATEAYQTYRKVSEDRRLQQAQETKLRIQVVDPPAPPIRPTGPSRLLLVLGGLACALIVALAVGALAEWLALRSQAHRSQAVSVADAQGPFSREVVARITQGRANS